MIGRLRGTIVHRGDDVVLLDVNGVGYVVHCSTGTLAGLPSTGQPVTLYTDLLVREDLLQLSGFLHPAERDLYRKLLTVQGVGARAAQSIVGTLGFRSTIRAITLGDWQSITAAPFIGKRISQRIVNELKEKMADLIESTGSYGSTVGEDGTRDDLADQAVANGSRTEPAGPMTDPATSSHADCISALVNLGYSRTEAAEAVALASREGDDADTAGLIRISLRLLARKSDQ